MQPDTSAECAVDLQVTAAHSAIAVGDVTEITAVMTNKRKEGIPMSVAIIGLPGGLEPRVEKLQELVKVRSICVRCCAHWIVLL